ncbi:MAG: hypothetical protein M3P06_09075 [Acidobacteriota bacterium]|nr:hypothetical protein [Acidobacteriota bacterium]
MAETNADDSNTGEVTFNDDDVWLLVSEVTIKRKPLLGRAFPASPPRCSFGLMDAHI